MDSDLIGVILVVLGTVVYAIISMIWTFISIVGWLQRRMESDGLGGAREDLDADITAAARGVSAFGPDVVRAASELLSLVGQHSRPRSAVQVAQRAMRTARSTTTDAATSTAVMGSTVVARGGAAHGSPVSAGQERAPSTPLPTSKRASPGSTRRRPRRREAHPAWIASTSAVQDVVARWFDIDNITLLLYLGATLIVIAAGIFVGSSWDAMGPMVRWGIVAFVAAAFFLVGEVFVQHSAQLARAGETFRGVGMVLMPIVGLAYDKFVLEGQAPLTYWFSLAVMLALVYYALVRWVCPGGLAASLAAVSGAVAAFLLPGVLGLDEGWTASSLLLASAGLMGAAWLADPDGLRGLTDKGASHVSSIAASHLVVGSIVGLLSVLTLVMDLDPIRPELSTIVYLGLVTSMLALASWWQRSDLAAGLCALAAGATIHQIGHFLMDDPEQLAVALVTAWSALAWAVYFVAPRYASRAPSPWTVLTGVAVSMGGAALVYALLGLFDAAYAPVDGLLLAASISLAAMFVALARRHGEARLFWPAAILLHVIVFEILRLSPMDGDLTVGPTLIWLTIAATWLYLSHRGRPEWASNVWAEIFVAEAVWAVAYASLDTTYLAAAVAGLALTAMWAVWTRHTRQPLGAAAAIAQASYAVLALLLLVGLPALIMPFALLVLGIVVLAIRSRLAADMKIVSEIGACIVLVVAPVAGYLAAAFGAPTAALGPIGMTEAGQIALLISLLVVGARGWEAQRRELMGIALVQSYLLYVWVVAAAGVSEVQLYSVPFGLLLLGLAWTFKEAREPLETVAAVAVLMPAAVQAAGHDTLLFTLLLGLWGIALLAAGMSFERRVLVAAGITGLLLAALRQLWEIVAMLPPGFVVGAVGLSFMAIAVLLTWRRDVVLDLGRKSGRYWDRMGRG